MVGWTTYQARADEAVRGRACGSTRSPEGSSQTSWKPSRSTTRRGAASIAPSVHDLCAVAYVIDPTVVETRAGADFDRDDGDVDARDDRGGLPPSGPEGCHTHAAVKPIRSASGDGVRRR